MNRVVTALQPLAPPLVAIALALTAPAAADEFETVPDRTPAELLPAALVSGPNFHVVDPVHGDGLMNHFVLDSRFGRFDAYGRAALAIRIREIAALTELAATSDVAVAAGGVVQGVESEVKTATGVVTHPLQTVTGIPKGIAHLFGGYQARGEEAATEAKNAVNSARGAGTSGSGGAASTGERVAAAGSKGEKAARSYAEHYLGITAAERDYYRKLGVDPYTDNKVLRDAIRRDARIEAGAGFGVRFVGLPAIPGIGIAQRTVDAIYNEDPAVIRERTRKTLAGLGLGDDEVEGFMNAPLLSPTRQLVLLAAVEALDGVAQRGELVRHAIGLTSDEEVQVYLRSAGLLAHVHASEPLTAVVAGLRLPAGLRADGGLVVCGAFESVYWTQNVSRLERQLWTALPPHTPLRRELWIAGTLSKRAQRAALDLGWELHQAPEEAPAAAQQAGTAGQP